MHDARKILCMNFIGPPTGLPHARFVVQLYVQYSTSTCRWEKVLHFRGCSFGPSEAPSILIFEIYLMSKHRSDILYRYRLDVLTYQM